MKRLFDFVAATPNAWVRLLGATWSGSKRINLRFSVDSGRNGPSLAHWLVAAEDVQQYSICDANGGGLQMWGTSHPVVRQYTDPLCDLKFRGSIEDADRVLGQLWVTHVAAADDWIPVDKYLPSPTAFRALVAAGHGRICRGPRFLMRRYAAVLER